MGFLELLTVLFILLKVFDVIAWSWWLVFSPMYAYLVAIVVYLFFILFAAIATVSTGAKGTRKKRK